MPNLSSVSEICGRKEIKVATLFYLSLVVSTILLVHNEANKKIMQQMDFFHREAIVTRANQYRITETIRSFM